jgi:hypothetical protein
VEIHDPLTYPQVIAFQEAISEVANMRDSDPSLQQLHFALLPGIFACIKEWNIENLPEDVSPENFPAIPPLKSAEFVDWLREEIMLMFIEAEEIPKE